MNYSPRQTVYLDKPGLRSLDDPRSAREAVIIQSGFVGRDGREWYVFERTSSLGELAGYDVAPYSAFYDTDTVDSNHRKELSSPEFATRFLQRAGILDSEGELAKPYREQ